MLLAELVSTADAVASTRSRKAKVEALAGLLRRIAEESPREVGTAVAMLVGKPRQGRVGVGWRGLSRTRGEAPPAAQPSITVEGFDALLDRLAATSGAGSEAVRTGLLAAFLRRATEREQRFIVGVLLGELRTGALEGVLVDALASAGGWPAALVRRAAMLSGDLGETARIALMGTEEDLRGVGLLVGRPVLPMLAASAATPAEALAATGEASVEFKLDGARIQVHRSGDDVRVFTRSLADVTHRVPEVVHVVRALPVREAILDGETLTLDEGGAPRPFQETMSRFGAERARDAVLHPWFFDVLHVDGRDLLDEPLAVRRAELARVAPGLIVPGEVTADPDTAERISREALAAGHEGVVVKAIGSLYSAGRRGSSWIKVKPVATYDLVVLAAEWGSGRRQGWLSNLHLGAYDPSGEFGEPGSLVMVGKTFKGLTDELLRWQTERFLDIEARRDGHTVFVEPTTVVEIAIDGVQRSSRYPGGVALRFARVKRYREDKDPAAADTIQSLRSLLT
ncbi:putative DNA ligase [Sinomonas atrocyanea]|uniref:Probable DNA ligase n=1 Tax=Sinomonas atrocyanea TaxID=37927 RepID=A0A127A473_9MICC|nr:ATP-dependent DNA ligase [Sinomonas atrocyanea]AMM33701.1 putative DNA ligase [Sinomonas atrocyanea]GEB63370.1 DNA ligase [Sinomonas atrocyanea]GGG53728.1 DNA ligase [Sinomonas atrocyanea]